MSRTRIVKGNITKVIGGDYKRYSKDDIENIGSNVIQIGKEGGVSYGEPEKYVPPPLSIVESKYKLVSTYAHDQLSSLAKELDEIPFMCFMIGVFGEEIEASALSKLYRGLSDKSITSPEIIVTHLPVNGRKANYSNHQKKILVWEHTVDLAVNDNDARAELMAMLVEEYGHHIDNLLRTELANKGKKDTDYIDEGAKFAYALFNFDIINESFLNYARAETPKYTGDLIIDFSTIHTQIKKYVNEEKQYDANPDEDEDGFGAGFEAGMHGGIEREALGELVKNKELNDTEVKQIYYGNWLRDYSQVVLESTVRLEKQDIDKIKQTNTKHLNDLLKSNPYKLSHDAWIKILEILATKEFMFGEENKFVHDYRTHLEDFRKIYGNLTKDILGIYRPEEHIDNPKQLEDFSSLSISFQYEYAKGQKTTLNLYKGELAKSLEINPTFNMKRFIIDNDIPDRPSSDTYMSQQLQLAVQYGKNKDGFRHLGAAFHVLEDYFSHSNFVELSLIKVGQQLLHQDKNSALGKDLQLVYPWVEGMQGKDYKTIPIVTGKFLKDDTAASVLPKVGDKMFPVGIQKYEQRKSGDRTFEDAFILTTLEDLSTGQQSDGLETDPVYMGMKTSEWLSMYNTYLYLIDQKSAAIGWMGKIGTVLDKGMSYMGDSLKTFTNIGFNLFLSSVDEDTKEEQTHNSNKNYGNNPTHTQIAKDATNHPLNPIASQLAKIAVKDVAERVLKIWKTGNDPTGEALVKYVTNKYTIHPMYNNATWADVVVKGWASSNYKNTDIIKRIQSATIYDHAHKVTQRVISNEKIQEILKYFQ
ncbi:hypothetical protein ASG31_15620 [Chryseobacterium sp. Leaf404]|uniref:HET-C-related protein n=1 Tax=unclassified Chryseobacterium TaxID=2593645 RepID=UPI0006FD7E49|nr:MULTISPECIES: HET-C-related protein [unclassified Chryseobacterium]KQT15030.1 hypothetical protein ASG31_15620 [Chryseobacterium sp. Leaf404]